MGHKGYGVGVWSLQMRGFLELAGRTKLYKRGDKVHGVKNGENLYIFKRIVN